jgi:DNA-binding transcriptional MocR family regulator
MARRASSSDSPIARPDPRAREALYLQVANAIEEALRAGRLRIGQRLPPERELAVDLDVSRTTVTGAYQELHARGLLRGHVGRGTVIVAAPADAPSAALPWSQRVAPLALRAAQLAYGEAPGSDVVGFANGWPDPVLYPAAVLDELLRGLAAAADASLYAPAPAPGDPALRAALARWLEPRGVRVAPEDILVTGGGQQGLNVVARAFCAPGDVVLTEAPTYPGALLAFRWTGAEVVGVPVDREGIQPDALEDALARYRPKLVYLIASYHNPTGGVLSRDRRRAVLELAARYRVPILDSELYAETYFETPPPPSLLALDGSGVVIGQGSFSKIAVPGLRLGWLIAPRSAQTALTAAKALVDLSTPPLTQRLAAAFLDGGHANRHLVALRAGLRLRRDRLVTALRQHCPRLRYRIPGGGYYLWAELPGPLTAPQLLASARAHGVDLRPGTQFMPESGGEEHVRLSFAALPPTRLVEGVRRLGAALDDALARLDGRPPREAAVPVSVV